MKNLILLLALLVLPNAAFAESSVERLIERIQIQGDTSDDRTYYYFFNSSGWGSPSCPNAVYAYLEESDKGSQAMLSLAMSAKAMQTNVKFLGSCDTANGQYLRVNYMFQM